MKRWIWIIILIVIVCLGIYIFFLKDGSEKNGKMRYKTEPVGRGDLSISILATGTITPYSRIEVNPPISGRIDSVLVDEGNFVNKGTILAWISSEDRVSLMDAANAELVEAQKSNNKSAYQEALRGFEIAKKAYNPIALKAPVPGKIINRSCEPGQNVSLNDILFVISDRLVARVEVDEVDIGKIKVGQKAVIILDSFPDDRVQGKVSKLAQEGKTVSDVVVYEVLVDPLGVPAKWVSGMTSNVSFVVQQKKDVLLVPKSAVQETPKGKFVFILEEDKPVRKKIVEGISDGKMIEVKKGLQEGEAIILEDLSANSSNGNGGGIMNLMRPGRRR